MFLEVTAPSYAYEQAHNCFAANLKISSVSLLTHSLWSLHLSGAPNLAYSRWVKGRDWMFLQKHCKPWIQIHLNDVSIHEVLFKAGTCNLEIHVKMSVSLTSKKQHSLGSLQLISVLFTSLLFLCLFLSLWPFQLYLIPYFLPTALRFPAPSFWCYFCLIGPVSYVSLYESLLQPLPWCTPL